MALSTWFSHSMAASRRRSPSTKRQCTRQLRREPLESRLLLSITPDWVSGIGGPGYEIAYDVAVGSSGNVHVSGSFQGTVDFDPGPAVENLIANPDPDVKSIFTAKYTSSGEFLWVKSMELGGVSGIGDSVVDELDNVYLTGYFEVTAQVGSETLTASHTDAVPFITKLDPNGNFLWAKNTNDPDVGGYGREIAVDDAPVNPAEWSVYLASESSNKLGTELWKFDADTGDTLWTKEIRGKGKFGNWRSFADGVAVDETGDVYLSGRFSGSVFFDDIKLTETNGTAQHVRRTP